MSTLVKTTPCKIDNQAEYYNLVRTNRAGEDQAIFDYENSLAALESGKGITDDMRRQAKAIFTEIRDDELRHSYMLAYLLGKQEGEQEAAFKAKYELIKTIGTDEPDGVNK